MWNYKTFGENTGINLHNIKLGRAFLDERQRRKQWKKKNWFGFIKIKCFDASMDIIEKVKDNPLCISLQELL